MLMSVPSSMEAVKQIVQITKALLNVHVILVLIWQSMVWTVMVCMTAH